MTRAVVKLAELRRRVAVFSQVTTTGVQEAA
jgi:hypothetical protein